MKKIVQFLLVAIMCIASLTINASEIYLVGSANGWYEPSEYNSVHYADWTLPETYEGSNIYQRVFELSAGEQFFRFYKALTGWDGGDSYGAIVEDSPVSIELTSGVYSGSMVQGKGSWSLLNWGGGFLTMTVNFNDNSVTFETFTGFIIDGITYKKTSDSEVKITEVYNGAELNIPSSVTYEGVNYSVTSLSQSAIKNCNDLVSVTIPSSLDFSTSYFDSCPNLETINIEEGHSDFSSIDGVLFSVDKTELMYCPKGKTGNYVIPDGVTTIGHKTYSSILGYYWTAAPFKGCAKLTSITFPGLVNDMAESSYNYTSCSNLAAFYVSDDNTTYASIDGVLTTKDKTKLLYYPAGKEGDYEIPETITVIEHMAFGCAKFSTITISENVASIGSYAFYDCPNLSTVNFNAKNCYVDGSYGTGLPYVYVGCGMTNLNIGESVENLNSYIFSGNGYFPESIVVPDNVISINSNAFYGSDTEYITIGAGVESISSGAFVGCNGLKSIEVAVDNKAYMSEDGVLFSKDKTTICAYPRAKEEKSYKIPSMVASIGSYAFYFCSMLESIELPATITSIGEYGFYGCQNLSSIVSLNPESPVCNEYSFPDDYYLNYDAVTVYVPVGASESYRNAVGWNKFSNIVEGASSIIEVDKNIDNAGVLDMSGSYVIGTEVTLTATANDGYEFSYWSENGIEVCADLSYTFTVGLSRNIVAIFSPIVNDNEVEVVAEEPNKVSINLDAEANASGYVVNIYSDETLTCLVATKCYDSAGNIVTQSTGISLTFDGLETGSYFYEIVVLEEQESETIVKSKYVGTFAITESEIECVVENQVGCIVVADGIKVINAGGRSIDVYDLSGHVVAHINVASDNETITLASGMYVVKVEHYVFKLKV